MCWAGTPPRSGSTRSPSSPIGASPASRMCGRSVRESFRARLHTIFTAAQGFCTRPSRCGPHHAGMGLVDVLAVVLALVMFVILYALIYGIDRI